jgi:hypothetical protein
MLVYAIDCPDHDGGLQANGARVYFGQTSKTIQQRLRTHGVQSSKCVRVRNWLIRRKAEGYQFRVTILASDVPRDSADAIERALIAAFRLTHDVLNLTSGGEGTVGRVVSEQTRARISMANLGRKTFRSCQGQNERDQESFWHFGGTTPKDGSRSQEKSHQRDRREQVWQVNRNS